MLFVKIGMAPLLLASLHFEETLKDSEIEDYLSILSTLSLVSLSTEKDKLLWNPEDSKFFSVKSL